MEKKKRWVREVMGNYMVNLAAQDERVVAVSADLGQKTWNVVFQPDENGNINLASGYNLLPMVLYPLFTAA